MDQSANQVDVSKNRGILGDFTTKMDGWFISWKKKTYVLMGWFGGGVKTTPIFGSTPRSSPPPSFHSLLARHLGWGKSTGHTGSTGGKWFRPWENRRKSIENPYVGYCPLPLTVTTRSIIFVIGDSYKPSFATVTGRGHHPIPMYHSGQNLWFALFALRDGSLRKAKKNVAGVRNLGNRELM